MVQEAHGEQRETTVEQVSIGNSTVAVRELTVPGAYRELQARQYTPSSKVQKESGLIVFFPAGGFVNDGLQSSDGFLCELAARSGCRVIGSSYTLASERAFPAAAEDAHAVLSWAARHRARHRRRDPLIVMGMEAGGNLAAVSALMARDRNGPRLAAQVLIMPMLDASLTSFSMREFAGRNSSARAARLCDAGYRGYLPRATDREHPYASPLCASRIKGLPPALILSADDDPLRDEAEQYGAKLAAAGAACTVRRLAPIELEEPDARCRCACKESALQEITAFIASLKA